MGVRPMVVVDPEPGAGRLPLGARVLEAADAALLGAGPAGVVVLARPGRAPADRLSAYLGRLLAPASDTGAVVAGGPPPAHDIPLAAGRDIGAQGGAEEIAVSAALAATSAIDPASDDGRHVVSALMTAARGAAKRVVSSPLWPAAGSAPVPVGGESSGILIVVGPGGSEPTRFEDREVAALVGDLVTRAELPVTLLCTERLGGPERRRWAAAGMDVWEGPAAWSGDRRLPPFSFSHLFFAAGAARSSVRRWIDRRQPQAFRTVFFPFSAPGLAAAWQAVGGPDERAALDEVEAVVGEEVARLVRWADAVWCTNRRDAEDLGRRAPAPTVAVVPPAVWAVDRTDPGAGMAIVAAEGADVLGGDEDAAERAVTELVAPIRRSTGAACTLVADRPTPALDAACRAAGVAVVGSDRLDEVLSSARVVLGAHTAGLGQASVLLRCLELATPFVATAASASGIDLADLCTAASSEDLVAEAVRLLTDDAAWRAARDRLAVAARRYLPERRDSAVARALAEAGVLVRSPPKLPLPPGPAPRPAFTPPQIGTRPSGYGEPPPLDRAPDDEKSRYDCWLRRRGPTPGALAALESEVAGLAYVPLVSVLLAVRDADPSALRAAVESVRAQIYPRWQLCIANDGSQVAGTLEVLAELRQAPDVVLVDREQPGGIAAAINAALAVATGEFVGFVEPDGQLKPHALAQVARWLDADATIDLVYSDEDRLDADGEPHDPVIKPGWSPDLLMTGNYIGHFLVVRRSIVDKAGGLRPHLDGAEGYDLLLRLSEETDRVARIPEPLYTGPGRCGGAEEPDAAAPETARLAVASSLERRGWRNRVDAGSRPGSLRPRYPLPGQPRVSIIVPTRNGRGLLERCLGSVAARSSYRNYEIVVIDNQSTEADTLEYLAGGPWRTIRYPHPFNYARMMNLAVRSVESDAVLLLNNDTEVISTDWIEALLEHAMRPEIGAVGAHMFFGDGSPQHEGIMLGIGGYAHNVKYRGRRGYGELIRNVTAVTGACVMMRPSVFWQVGGFDERYRVAYNDVDLSLRIRQAGYEVLYTPYAELYHHEGSSRGTFERRDEGPRLDRRWHVRSTVDPYYSPMYEDLPPWQIRV